MNRRIIHWVCILGAVRFLFSCSYPEARLLKDTSAAGNQGLKIIYPSAKMHTLQTTGKNGMAAVFFTFNDFIQMEFIPYGPIIDNRWFYYMGIVDAQCNPVLKRFLLFDEQKKSACNYSGQTQAVFPTHDGFIAVYLIGNDFVYTEFDVNGKVLNKRVKFFRSENETIETNRVLSIDFFLETVYLFILQPPVDMYRDRWHIDFVKRDLNHNNMTKIMNNIIPNQEGWYYAKNMETYFAGDSVCLAWIDGQKQDSLSDQGMYTLSSVVYFAKGAVNDTVFKSQIVMTSDHYNECETRMMKSGKGMILITKESDMIWIQNIDENGRFAGERTKVEDHEKSFYVSAFSPSSEFPCSVIVSSE